MKTRGFTLLEMMVVLAILAVLGTAVVALFVGGMRAWEDVREINEPQALAALGFEIPERDLHNTVPFFAIPFHGTADSIEFPICFPVTNGVDPGPCRIGTVRYALDRTRKLVGRAAWLYPFPGPTETMAETVLEQVQGLTLQYLEVSTNGTVIGWRDSWLETNQWPMAVRWTVQGGWGGHPATVQRTLFLPSRPTASR